jgi:KDO2-lipid IV(A) lauroyltransferase
VGRARTDSAESIARRTADTAIAAVFRGFLRLCALLPQRWLPFLASGASTLVWPLNTTARRITERNIAIALPELPLAEKRSLAKASFSQLFRCVADLGSSWLWPVERVVERFAVIVGEEHLRESIAHNRGVILLLPHLGNWEVIGTYLATRYPVTTLYKGTGLSALDDLIHRARQRHGNRLVPADKSGVRTLMCALKSREIVVVLPDQVPARESGEFAPFFGEPALTMTLVTKLIHRFGCRAVFGYAKHQPDNSYELVFRPADEDIYSDDPATALAALNKSVEQCVLDCPEQYRWEYKRYKHLPDFSRRESY